MFKLSIRLFAVVLGCLAQAEPLTLARTQSLAEQHALAPQRAAVLGAVLDSKTATLLPDPKLLLGINNLPITGADAGRLKRDFMTMQMLGIMQEVPSRALRAARREAAQAKLSLREMELSNTRLQIRRASCQAWWKRFYSERKLLALGELEQENKLLATTLPARLQQGDSNEVLLARENTAQLQDLRDELERDLQQSRAQLRRWIGEAAELPLDPDPPPLTVVPKLLIERQQQHPELGQARAEINAAQADVNMEQAMQKPSWAWEASYQRRARQFGDMVSVQLSLDLPLWQGSLQTTRIAAKRATLASQEAAAEQMARTHQTSLQAELAEFARLDKAVDRQQHTWLPLLEQKLTLQISRFGAGKASLQDVLMARQERLKANLKLLDLQNQRAQIAAALDYAEERQ